MFANKTTWPGFMVPVNQYINPAWFSSGYTGIIKKTAKVLAAFPFSNAYLNSLYSIADIRYGIAV